MNDKFRRRANQPRLLPEEAVRQGRAARLAWEAFPGPGAAIAFLNTFDAGLGGRPIDLAVADADGLLRVEQAIAARARGPLAKPEP